jgi:hypothetical protein
MLEIWRNGNGHNTIQRPEEAKTNDVRFAIEHHTHWWTNSNPTYWQHDKLQLHTLKHGQKIDKT